MQPEEILVVDDHSTDRTAEIARSFGATLIHAEALPPGWTGKTWACAQGASAAKGDMLLFLDADTQLGRDGLARMSAAYVASSQPAALSVLPFHRMERPYEQLSLFFNLIMAAGAGGFSGLVAPQLFGQSLLIDRNLYDATGGHGAVRHHVLENLHLASHVREAGGHPMPAIGEDVLTMRMFPEGVGQLTEGWTKGFAAGAANTPAITVWLIGLWIAGAMLAAINLFLARSLSSGVATAIVYAFVALQCFLASRRLGSFKTCAVALYPVMLAYYLAIFARSVILRRRGSGATWKGRTL